MNNTTEVEEKLTVLLVDDQKIVAAAITQHLKSSPLTVIVCDSGARAVEVAKKERPAVILQDLVMPEHNGLELLALYKKDPLLQAIPVMILSTTEDVAVKSEAFQKGATDYVVKFPDPIELAARVLYHARSFKNAQAFAESERQKTAAKRFEALAHLASGLAHEMNSPLQFIRANLEYLSQTLRNTDPTALQTEQTDMRAAATETVEGVDRLGSIIETLQNLIPASTNAVEKMTVAQLIAQCTESFSNKPLQATAADTARAVMVVPSELLSMISELVHNAEKAIQRKGGATPPIIQFSTDGVQLSCTVIDQGDGISEQYLTQLGTPFFTAGKVGVGRGIGLSRLRSVLEGKYQGRFSVKSDANGTAVTISLPLLA